MVLGAIAVVIIAYAGVSNVNVSQQASSLTSEVAQNARKLSSSNGTNMQFANKDEEAFYNKITSTKKPQVSVTTDASLDIDVVSLNTPSDSAKSGPTGSMNRYTNWGPVSFTTPNAQQTMVLTGNQLISTNRVMISAGNFPIFITQYNLHSSLAGTKNNPTLPFLQYMGGENRIIETSTNVVLKPVDYYDKQGNYKYTENMIMIPANQTGYIKTKSFYDVNKLYPDTYSSNINTITATYAYFDMQTGKFISYPNNNYEIITQPNQTNKVAVVGETGPYITNYPTNTGVIGINDPITLEGYRFGASATVKVRYWDQINQQSVVVPDFTLPTVASSYGKKAVSFTLAGQNITLPSQTYIGINLVDANGSSSNYTGVFIQ